MATYKSEETTIPQPAEKVYSRISNLEGLGEMIKNVPEDKIDAEKRAMLEQVRVSADTISFPAGPAGEVTLKLVEAVEPSLLRMEGVGTPVPISLSMFLTPIAADMCTARVEIDIKIPAMLKPMVSGPLQKMVDQFAQMLRNLPYA